MPSRGDRGDGRSIVARFLLPSVKPVSDLQETGNDRDDQGDECKKFKEGSHVVFYRN